MTSVANSVFNQEKKMAKINEVVKTADFKSEKHVPVIEAPETVKAGDYFTVSATVGKEIEHPNTVEHHMAWIALHFIPASGKVSYEVGRCEFSAHGQSVAGPNLGPVYTGSAVSVNIKLNESGTLCATAYCNIHGLWASDKAITVQ